MAQSQLLAAYHELGHFFAAAEHGVAPYWLLAKRDGSGECLWKNEYDISPALDLLISDCGFIAERIGGATDPYPSDLDMEYGIEALRRLHLNGPAERRALLMRAEQFLWARADDITWTVPRLLERGYLATEHITSLVHEKGSPLARFKPLYPLAEVKAKPKAQTHQRSTRHPVQVLAAVGIF